jgi:hypothetical protein
MNRLPHNLPTIAIGVPGVNPTTFGAPFRFQWTYRPLPGAGANQWAWETEALPVTTPGGAGSPNVRQGMMVTQPGVGYAYQGAVAYGVGDPGSVAGQWAFQPLMDADRAAQLGIASPAAFPSFAIPSGGA